MVGCGLFIKKETDWLRNLLEIGFFRPCFDHQNVRKNAFCIHCSLGFCRRCKAHSQHPSLQIFKYVYEDVVRLQEIQKLLDCSKIQTYKINGEKAIHLNPRPRAKDAKPSTKSKNGGACQACRRYLQDPHNRFCSIACKGSAVELKPKDQSDKLELPTQEFPDLSWKDNNQNSDIRSEGKQQSSISSTVVSGAMTAWVSTASLKPTKRMNRRKGIPHRAPLS